MNYARVIGNIAVDVAVDPGAVFTPEVAAQFVEVPDEVSNGWVRLTAIDADGQLVNDETSWQPPRSFIESYEVPGQTEDDPPVTKYRYAVAPEVPRPVYPEPPPPVPASVTMRQARLALLQEGLLDDVETAINALPEPQQSAARIEWEYSNEVQRHNGFVEQIGPMLGLTSQELDELFILAATL